MDAPPPYIPPSSDALNSKPENEKQNNISTSASSQPQQQFQAFNNPNTIFPSNFGVYHAPSSFSDLCIATSADSSKTSPLFYISKHGAFSSQPDVVIHSQSVESSPPMATAIFHSFSSSIDIHLFLPSGQKISTKVEREGAFTSTYGFTLPLANGNVEKFEWKSSRGMEVRNLNGRSHGMKLVRCSTGHVVAAWTGPNAGSRKKGKMAFLGNNGDPRFELGIAFEILTVITVIALVEKARRNNSSGAAAGGAAAC